MGLAAAVVSHSGQLRAANRLFESMVHQPASRLSHCALEAAAGGVLHETMSVPVPAQAGRYPLIVHVSPVRGAAHDIFSRSAAIVLVTPISVADVPSANMLQGLFDLTPAEARVARALGQGVTVESIASNYSVAVHTVRNQIRSIFSKTGVNRQADLVGLLAGAPVPARLATDDQESS